MMSDDRIIRTGIGGWTFKPWRGTFYPKGLRQADELEYATSQVSAIEINGTYYRLQKPESFAKWRDAAPAGFKYAIKASRYCTNRKDLRETGESIERFLAQGIAELGDTLGPLFWQFMPTKKFDPEEFDAFLEMLPKSHAGLTLSHALEVRHESFVCAEFVELARKHNAAIICAHNQKYPLIADQTADFSYARLMGCREEIETGYPVSELETWANTACAWRDGDRPDEFDLLASHKSAPAGRDIFVFFISGAKIRAPAAAAALMERLAS